MVILVLKKLRSFLRHYHEEVGNFEFYFSRKVPFFGEDFQFLYELFFKTSI